MKKTMISRILKNTFSTHLKTSRIFNTQSLTRIKASIAASELGHSGQIRFVVETALPTNYLLRGLSPRQRAIEVFSNLGVWDTEQNNGVLIYLLISEKVIEIVADRGVNAKIGADFWGKICNLLTTKFKEGAFEDGVLEAISHVDLILRQKYPNSEIPTNELPDSPVIL
jgi:uncharacterized membrane protein